MKLYLVFGLLSIILLAGCIDDQASKPKFIALDLSQDFNSQTDLNGLIDLNVLRDLNVGRNTTLLNDVNIGRDLRVDRNVFIQSDLNVNNATIRNNLTVKGNQTTTGDATFRDNVFIGTGNSQITDPSDTQPFSLAEKFSNKQFTTFFYNNPEIDRNLFDFSSTTITSQAINIYLVNDGFGNNGFDSVDCDSAYPSCIDSPATLIGQTVQLANYGAQINNFGGGHNVQAYEINVSPAITNGAKQWGTARGIKFTALKGLKGSSDDVFVNAIGIDLSSGIALDANNVWGINTIYTTQQSGSSRTTYGGTGTTFGNLYIARKGVGANARTLEIGVLESGGVEIPGVELSPTAFYPAQDNNHTSGTTALRWKATYSIDSNNLRDSNTTNLRVYGNALLDGNQFVNVLGSRIFVKAGTNSCYGFNKLVAGSITVSTSCIIDSNSDVSLDAQDSGGLNVGSLWISAKTPGTSFVISSSNILDDRNVAWDIRQRSG